MVELWWRRWGCYHDALWVEKTRLRVHKVSWVVVKEENGVCFSWMVPWHVEKLELKMKQENEQRRQFFFFFFFFPGGDVCEKYGFGRIDAKQRIKL